jgi:hypothetical protein
MQADAGIGASASAGSSIQSIFSKSTDQFSEGEEKR